MKFLFWRQEDTRSVFLKKMKNFGELKEKKNRKKLKNRKLKKMNFGCKIRCCDKKNIKL